MSHKLYLTQLGQQKLAELATVGTGQALRLTDFAVGSGRDVDFSKRLDRQTLVAKKYQAHVQDVVNIAPNQYEISCVIPADVGGFTIREVGLYADNILMWVGSLPEVQKPTLESLSAVDYRIKCIVTIDNTDVRLVVDGNVVTATQKWVLDTIGDNLQAEITKILAEIETLKNRPIIPVGGLFATTKHYANGEAVTANVGYGKWMRALIGRTGVGYDPNADDWTGTMGQKYGANEHTLTVAEMPSHTHDWLHGKEGDDDGHGGSHEEFTFRTGTMKGSEVIGETGGNRPHNNVQKSEVIAYWKRMPDNYVQQEPVIDVYFTSDKQGKRKITEINEGQNAYLWVEAKNLPNEIAIGAKIDAKNKNINMEKGDFTFPKTIDNGKVRIGEMGKITTAEDATIKMGIYYLNEPSKEFLANLLVKNQDVGRRTTTLQFAIQQQSYDGNSLNMLNLPNIIVSGSSADDENYSPEFVEFDNQGNRRLSNNNARQAGFFPSGSLGEKLNKAITAMSNPRLHDIWFYIPAKQAVKHIGITSSQAELFGYRVERYTGVYNGLYADNLPNEIRNQSKDWIILRANDTEDKTLDLIRQAQNKDLDIDIDF